MYIYFVNIILTRAFKSTRNQSYIALERSFIISNLFCFLFNLFREIGQSGKEPDHLGISGSTIPASIQCPQEHLTRFAGKKLGIINLELLDANVIKIHWPSQQKTKMNTISITRNPNTVHSKEPIFSSWSHPIFY